jgi:hypothetical protein
MVHDSGNQCFLFTITNPHNVPPRRFHINPSANQTAMQCNPCSGPIFGNSDLSVSSTTGSTKGFGQVYINDTGLEGETFFTGSPSFTIKEIEVFEVTALPAVVTEAVPSAAFPLSSFIASHLPEIFIEFQGKKLSLLWRGSSDGFFASDFHLLCDGHANTLTLIRDTQKNVFGGFTPIPWASEGYFKGDDSLKSFLFTLTHNGQPSVKRFPLREEMKDNAIFCLPARGPAFGNDDLVVSDRCTGNAYSCVANFGEVYCDDEAEDKEWRFIGSPYFKVDDIEVFEVIP